MREFPEHLRRVRCVSAAMGSLLGKTGTIIGQGRMSPCWVVKWDHLKSKSSVHRSYVEFIEESIEK